MMKKLSIMLITVVALLSSGCHSPRPAACLFGGTVAETKSYLDRYEHVLLVCVTKDHVTRGEHPARSDLHFTGTVVRVYKGQWAVSENISWTHELDERIPIEANKHAGELFFVFANTHTDEETFLDTGDWPRWSEGLAKQIEDSLE
jgi:hypothetical protein